MKNIDWKILTVLYESRSMTKAAEALYMTQSALTKRIQAMESEWNVQIVRRSSKGVIFTEEGQYLVRKANIMLDFMKDIEEHFAETTGSKPLLKIGIPNSFARLHMPKILKAYEENYDQLQIRTVSNSSDVLIQKLTDGSIDIGIICGDYPYLGEKICLFEEALYVVAPKEKKLDDIGQMPLIKSYLNPLVKLLVDQWWRGHFGSLPHESHGVPYADIAIEMVEQGLGITFLFGADWRIDRNKLEMIPICDREEHPVTRKVWMMLSDRCCQSQQMMDFVTLVEEFYRTNM